MQHMLISHVSDLDKACSVSLLIAALVSEPPSHHRRWILGYNTKKWYCTLWQMLHYWWQHLSLSISILTGPVSVWSCIFYLEKDLDILDIFMGSNDCANVQKEEKTQKYLTITHREEKRCSNIWWYVKGKLLIYPQYWFSMYGCWQQIFFNFIVFPKN